ncbi:nicotinamide riboside transporter PnuC [Pedobacter sp.]|uniref:nicotinamide riboside transporter PnuC n=1 Tax=Pedobacter sp. TaxID=1411316 RepID=UPI003D7F2E1C
MDLKDWYLIFVEQLTHTTLLEWLAVSFGVTEVFLAKRNNIWLYPTGIISILLSMYLLANVRLYAETLLNIYYLVMSVYGWLAWRKRGSLKIVAITWSTNRELKIAVLISTLGFALLYIVLKHYTDSDVPIWDAFVSSTAWAGMWLLAKRKIENWIFLNISNLFAIPLLIHKQLPMFAVLTFILFIVAIFGFLDWKRILNQKQQELSHQL